MFHLHLHMQVPSGDLAALQELVSAALLNQGYGSHWGACVPATLPSPSATGMDDRGEIMGRLARGEVDMTDLQALVRRLAAGGAVQADSCFKIDGAVGDGVKVWCRWNSTTFSRCFAACCPARQALQCCICCTVRSSTRSIGTPLLESITRHPHMLPNTKCHALAAGAEQQEPVHCPHRCGSGSNGCLLNGDADWTRGHRQAAVTARHGAPALRTPPCPFTALSTPNAAARCAVGHCASHPCPCACTGRYKCPGG